MHTDKPKVYGLVIPKKPGQQTRARPAPAPKRAPNAAFSLEDDDEDEDNELGEDPLASKQSFNAMLQVHSALCAVGCVCVCVLEWIDRSRRDDRLSATHAWMPRSHTHPYPTHHPQARSERARQQAEAAAKAAMAEDPSIYDYDGVYDVMQRERGERAKAAAAAVAKEEKQGSKYIESLKRVGGWVGRVDEACARARVCVCYAWM